MRREYHEAVRLGDFHPGAFPAGHQGWHWLELAAGLLGPLKVPVALARGRRPGPTLLAVAGVHGDEFEGVAAIGDFFKGLEVDTLSGTFVGLPVANPFAFEGQLRETPALWDGLNLARQFPGQPEGSLTQRLAHALSSWALGFLGGEDAFIDFHSAGTRYEYLSMVGYHPTGGEGEARSRRMAAAFGLERIWEIPDSPASRTTFNGCLARRGIPTLGTEVCGRGGMVEADAESLRKGLGKLLAHQGMIPDRGGDPARRDADPAPAWRTGMALAQTSGLFKPVVGLDEQLSAGQVLGRVCALTGRVLEEIRAPDTGRVWGLRRFSTVRAGEYVALLGAPARG